MAKRKRGRRNGSQRQPQPTQNTLQEEIARLLNLRRIRLGLIEQRDVNLPSDDHQSERQTIESLTLPPSEHTILSDVTAGEIGDNENGGFHVITRRRSPTRTRRERGTTLSLPRRQSATHSTRPYYQYNRTASEWDDELRELERQCALQARSAQERAMLLLPHPDRPVDGRNPPAPSIPPLNGPVHRRNPPVPIIPQLNVPVYRRDSPPPNIPPLTRPWAEVASGYGSRPNRQHSTENPENRQPPSQDQLHSEELLSPQQRPLSPTTSSSISDSGWDAPIVSLDLKGLAENASILLELFGRSHDNGDEAESRQLIESAFESITKVRRYYKVTESQSGKPRAPPEEQNDEVKIDAGCIICYTEIADTLLVPCNHLVLCASCCDLMGIQDKSYTLNKSIPCPICRRNILDRIKVFRCT